MTTLSIHACSPSPSLLVKVENVSGNLAGRPSVILSLLPARRRYARLLSSRGPSLFRLSRSKGLLLPRASLGQLPDPEHVDMAVNALSQAPEALQGMLTRAEGMFFTLADAAVATDPGQVADTVQKQSGGWLGGITDTLEMALTFLKDGLAKLHVPYSYGFAIILLTVLVKAATYPLTKQQVESTLAMQNLQPKLKAIQGRYKGDQERIQLETARLYKQAGVNPLAGCLPTLATLPVWIGLYRALSNVANEGLLTEGFFWIPSLAGPTTIAARTTGSGISWIFPFVDGSPPLGWGDTAAYLVLPVLLIASQYVSMQLMQPPQTSDPSQNSTQVILKFLPLMIGYFSLSVPSGLSLYWLTNNVLSTAQQVYLRQGGGAKPIVDKDGGDIISAGQAKRTSLPSSSASTATTTTAPPARDSRGERFRQLKEEEAKKKEARRRAAEEASKAAAAASAEERGRMLRAQRAEEAQKSSAANEETRESEEDGDDGDGESYDVTETKDSLEEAFATNGAADSSSPKRSKRSKRRRAP